MSLEKLRNIGIVAHIDAGKTTVTERILYYSGNIRKMGEVHDGKATMDFMTQEQERGITIASAAITCAWKDHQINIIDTPGHVDFIIEVERSLRVLDGVVAVFCGVNGVEAQTETVWNQAQKHKVPKIAFINKMDTVGADFETCVKMMTDQLEANPVKFQFPLFEGEELTGVIDLVAMKALIYKDGSYKEEEIPEKYLNSAQEAHKEIIEKLTEYSDEMLEQYMEDKPIDAELIKKTARDGVLKSIITPVFCGAAYKNIGVQNLLDAVIDYLPSPLDIGVTTGFCPDDPEKVLTRKPSADENFSALAFKIIHDPFVGQQTFTRIYSGKISQGDTVLNTLKNKEERISKILKIHAQDRQELKEASAGDIVALIGTKNTTTGDTLSSPSNPILFEKITAPESVISIRVSVLSQQENDKLGISLKKIAMEDPSFGFRTDEETKEIIISGMGELHLEIIVDRLKREFGVNAETGSPSISFRETITRKADCDKRYVKQSGGKGQFAHCVISIEPNDAKGFEFIDRTKGGVIPKEYIPAVKKGIEEAMQEGAYAGYPVVDVKCELLDGTTHEVDSSEFAFKTAASMAFKEAFKKASPLMLEPVMKIEINSPDQYLGDIMGDLTRRRGKINNMRRFRKGSQKITGTVPLKEMFGYATALRTLSSGRATFSMEFFKYLPAPKNIEEEILKKKKEEDKN
ncbi:MAG: elongation factor G [Armatimonadota bacterium]